MHIFFQCWKHEAIIADASPRLPERSSLLVSNVQFAWSKALVRSINMPLAVIFFKNWLLYPSVLARLVQSNFSCESQIVTKIKNNVLFLISNLKSVIFSTAIDKTSSTDLQL